MIYIKPHHLLDILKLFGGGYRKFTRDKTYKHSFYDVGNTVLENPAEVVEFTIELDDVCKKCIYAHNGECLDRIPGNTGLFNSKGLWNKEVDRRIMKELKIVEGDQMKVIEFAKLASNLLTPTLIKKIWKERPFDETSRRIKLLTKGLKIYLSDSSLLDKS